MGNVFLCGISEDNFKIPHKIYYPYIERYRLYSHVKIKKLLDLRAQKCFWHGVDIPNAGVPHLRCGSSKILDMIV